MHKQLCCSSAVYFNTAPSKNEFFLVSFFVCVCAAHPQVFHHGYCKDLPE